MSSLSTGNSVKNLTSPSFMANQSHLGSFVEELQNGTDNSVTEALTDVGSQHIPSQEKFNGDRHL